MPGSRLDTRKHGPTRTASPGRRHLPAERHAGLRLDHEARVRDAQRPQKRLLRDGPHPLRRQQLVGHHPGRRPGADPPREAAAARPSAPPAVRPAASCTAAPARRTRCRPARERNSTCKPRSASGTRLVGLTSTALATRPLHCVATKVWQATLCSPRRTNSVGSCRRRPATNVAASMTGSVSWPSDVALPEQFGGGRACAAAGSGRRGGSGRRLRPGGGCRRRSARGRPGASRKSALRRAGSLATQLRLDQDGLGVPRDGLVVQRQAGFLVADSAGPATAGRSGRAATGHASPSRASA